MNVTKKILILVVMAIMVFSLAGCNGSYGTKSKDLDDPMPELWEETLSGKAFDASDINIAAATEITIGADITDINLGELYAAKNLQNIFVTEGNQKFASDEGVLYSKSYQTLYRWPVKKPVTTVRETVKYFAPGSFSGCDMPEDFELPDGTVTIGASAFAGTNLTKLHIKSNVKSVGRYFFPDTCKRIEISTPIVYVSFYSRGNDFSDYFNSIETIIFNEGVRQIRAMGNGKREHLFSMMGTKYIEFPSSLEAIGDVSFPINVMVANYIIPEKVNYLGKYAFDDYYVKPNRNPFIKEKPVKVPREVKTAFDCKSETAVKYIEANLSVWKRTA